MTTEPVSVVTAPAPRTRSARTADSRLLILDAAVACLVEDGASIRVQVEPAAGA